MEYLGQTITNTTGYCLLNAKGREEKKMGQSKINCKYTEQNYKCNTFIFAPIFHELSLKYC